MIARPAIAGALAMAAALAAPGAAAAPGGAAKALAPANPERDHVGEAEALFGDGRKLYDAGQFEEACSKLAESQRLDPRVGTAGLLASCNEQRGRLATAYRQYLQAAELARAMNDPRGRFAGDRAAVLEPKVPRLRVGLQARIADLQISLNGEDLRASELDTDVPVDPGVVKVAARAPGRARWLTSVHLAPGARVTVEVPDLAPLAASASPAPEPQPAAPRANERRGSAWRTAGFVVGGVGLVGVGVGAGFGLLAISRRSDSEPYCDDQSRCTPRGGELRDEAKSAADVGTASFAIGLAGVGAGAALLVLSSLLEKPHSSPSGRQSPPLGLPVVLSGSGVAVTGRF